ncbi:MAG: hypothetical protein U1E89_02470 [Burkholderiaceae bacterium]
MKYWHRCLIASALSSAAAVGLQTVQLPVALPHALMAAAEVVASPGEFLWWSTLGGAFAGRPTGAAGHLIWVAGSAAFWFVAAWAVGAVLARLVSGARHREGDARNPGR